MVYLDAGFPFLDGFPLLPHLSHDDGKAIDLAFFYQDAETGRAIPAGGAWPLGYWAYSGPRPGEPTPCPDFGGTFTLRWDFDWLQPMFADLRLDSERTKAMVAWLAQKGRAGGVRKLLLEPHLKSRLGLSSDLVRFQGCRAARHDDHVHIDFN